MKNYLKLLLIAFMLTSSFLSAQERLSKAELGELFQISKELVEYCDSQNCLFIGLGGSPTVLTEFITHSFNQKTMHLPLSAFQYKPGGLKGNRLQRLFFHFDNIFEQEGIELSNFNDVIIFDYGLSGKSLASSSHYLAKYFQERKVHISLKSIVYGEERLINTSSHWGSILSDSETWIHQLENKFQTRNLHFIDISGFKNVNEAFEFWRYDIYRKYPKYNLNQSKNDQFSRKYYTQQRAYIGIQKEIQSYSQKIKCESLLK